MAFTKICKISDVKTGCGRGVEINGKSVAVFNLDGNFYAINDICGHRGGPLRLKTATFFPLISTPLPQPAFTSLILQILVKAMY